MITTEDLIRAKFRSPRKANLGRALETTIIASQRNIVRLDKIPHGVRYLPGGKKIAVKSPVDFVGTVCATGRAIHFDAKMSAKPQGLYLDQIEKHQIAWLVRHGEAGAIAGVLAESTKVETAGFYWIDWRNISRHIGICSAAISWGDMRWIGDSFQTIDFGKILGVA